MYGSQRVLSRGFGQIRNVYDPNRFQKIVVSSTGMFLEHFETGERREKIFFFNRRNIKKKSLKCVYVYGSQLVLSLVRRLLAERRRRREDTKKSPHIIVPKTGGSKFSKI